MAAAEADEEVLDQESEDGESGGESGKKRLPGKKLVLFVVLPLVLLLAGAGGAWVMGYLDPLLGVEPVEGEVVEEEAPQAFFYELPDLLVNLSSAERQNSYLKLSVSLELESQDDVDVIEALLPRIIDNFQVYLRELRIEDLRGSAGLTRLREQLLMRINVAARPARVSDVLFREMLVQ